MNNIDDIFSTPDQEREHRAEEQRREEQAEGRLLADGFRDTDVGNAERLVAAANGEIRYVHAWGKWLVYRDGTWQIDPGQVMVREKAKLVAAHMRRLIAGPKLTTYARDELYKWQKRSESAPAIGNMIQLAAGIPGVLTDHNDLDRKPELLNVLNGTVDLRTGELLPHDPEHLLTKQAPVVYDPSASAPLWEASLRRWQPDELMRAYLQLEAGAGATGYAVQEVHVHHGGGRNGKGVCYGTLMHVLGPYAVVPDKSLLVVQKHEPHPTVWAHLFGARLAVAAETQAGDRLNEEKVKKLTGGDRIDGRRMREDTWEFDPSHLLVVSTNHIPQVRTADEAMRRRLRLIPWDVTIPDKEDNRLLADQLRAEAPGVLNWIVAGAREWLARERVLPMPPPVKEATEGLFRQADPLGWFLSIATAEGNGSSVTTAQLHEAYCCWRTEPSHDEPPPGIDVTELGSYVRDRGYRKARLRVNGQQAMGWRGLALRPEYVELVEWVRANQPNRLRYGSFLSPTGRGL